MTRNATSKPLSDDDILSTLRPILQKALDGATERNAKFENCLKLYNRDPFPGDEEIAVSKSRFVSSDVFEHTEMLSAQMLSLFEGQEDVVTFVPRGPEDEALANQQTQVINWVLRDDNELTTFLDDWFKNGLIYGIGVVYAEFYSDDVWRPAQTLEAVPDQLLTQMMSDEMADVQAVGDPYPSIDPAMGMPVMVRDVEIAKADRKAGIRLTVVKPEDVVLSSDATFSYATGGIDAGLQGFRTTVPRRQLVEMGYPAELVEGIPDAHDGLDTLNDLRRGRGMEHDDAGATEAEIVVFELFAKLDIEGRGKAPLVHFTIAGEEGGSQVLLAKEIVECAPFAAFIPVKDPNTLTGKGVADIIGRDQRYKSLLYRAQQDNLHQTLHPRPLVDMDSGITSDDLFNDEIGAPIRYSGSAGIDFHMPPPVGAQALAAIDRLNADIEGRTGTGAQTMALDPSDLKRTTATASTQRLSMAMLRTDKMARLFAGTGYRYLFRVIGSLLAAHPADTAIILDRMSLTAGVVPMAPDSWNTSLDVRANVSFGNTDKVAKTNALMNILALQKEALGAGLPFVTPQHIHHTVSEIIQLNGFRNTQLFMSDPRRMAEEGAPPEEPKPDPEIQKMEAELAMKRQVEEMKIASAERIAMATLEMKNRLGQQELAMKYRTGQQEMGAEIFLEGAKLDAGGTPQVNIPSPYSR